MSIQAGNISNGSLNLLSSNTFLHSLKNAAFISEEIFILLTPRFTDSAISSSGLADPPCNTRGTETFDFISLSKSNFKCGSNPSGYIPWAVPIAIAKQSHPVASTNFSASSGFV